jgi:hypothetical protein
LLRPDGLTALQYTALTVLGRHPDMSVAQLARNSFVTAQSMADMVPVNALESRMLHGTTKPQVTALRRTLTTCHANLAPGQPRLP